MSFSDCPLVVLDQIFRQLEVAELRALSLTCKSLHPCANHFLYRKADDFVTERDQKWHPWLPKSTHHKRPLILLERSLAENPQNAVYIRSFTVTSLSRLEHLWNVIPLALTQLRIFDESTTFCGAVPLTKMILAKHPDTSIEELSVKVRNPRLNNRDDIYRVFPKLLHHFNGLRKFTIFLHHPDVRFVFPSAMHILAYLKCPNLEHLVIKDGGAKGIVCPDDNLPNLKFFEILPEDDWEDPTINPSHGYGYTSDDDLEALRMLMEKGIYFRYGVRFDTLVEFIHEQPSSHCNRFLKWLLESEYRLQITNNENNYFIVLNFHEFGSTVLNKVLRVIPTFPLQLKLKLILRHRPLPAFHHLAKHISHLALEVDRIAFPVIKNILADFSQLTVMWIATRNRNPIRAVSPRIQISILLLGGLSRPDVVKFVLNKGWETGKITEESNVEWASVTNQDPAGGLRDLKEEISICVSGYPHLKDVRFYFMRDDSNPVPWSE